MMAMIRGNEYECRELAYLATERQHTGMRSSRAAHVSMKMARPLNSSAHGWIVSYGVAGGRKGGARTDAAEHRPRLRAASGEPDREAVAVEVCALAVDLELDLDLEVGRGHGQARPEPAKLRWFVPREPDVLVRVLPRASAGIKTKRKRGTDDVGVAAKVPPPARRTA
jgi:hypothetical protein